MGWWRRRHAERGQSLVELSLVLPLILLIVIGIAEVGDALNAQVTLVDAARDGARLGSKNLASDDQIRNLVMVETGRLRGPVQPQDIVITRPQVSGAEAVSVRVCDNRPLILHVPLVLPEGFRTCSQTTMRVLPPQP